MTSSNGADWGTDGPDGSVRVRIRVDVDQAMYSQLVIEAEEQCRSITDQIRFMLKQQLLNKEPRYDRDTRMCVSVGAGGGDSNVTTDNLPLQFFPHQQAVESTALETAVDPAVPAVSSISLPKECLGEESEEPPLKKKGSWKKEFPPCLEEFESEITEFWREKKGSKSERAWNLLMKELSAIHAHLNVGRSTSGRETFLEQLEVATANRFQGITLKNFKQFAEGTPGKAPEPELKHPASKVFRASDQQWPAIGSSW